MRVSVKGINEWIKLIAISLLSANIEFILLLQVQISSNQKAAIEKSD